MNSYHKNINQCPYCYEDVKITIVAENIIKVICPECKQWIQIG